MFGGIRENAKAKDLKKAEDMIDTIVLDHQSDVGDYYIFLLDKQPTDAIKQLILNRIRDEGYTNYMVLNAVECKYHKEDLKGEGLTDFMVKHRSSWRTYLNDYEGKHCKAIMCFGIPS